MLFESVAREGLVEQIDPVQYSIRLLVPSGSLLLRDPIRRPCSANSIRRASAIAGRIPTEMDCTTGCRDLERGRAGEGRD
jgi:hypothetical protein